MSCLWKAVFPLLWLCLFGLVVGPVVVLFVVSSLCVSLVAVSGVPELIGPRSPSGNATFQGTFTHPSPHTHAPTHPPPARLHPLPIHAT